MKKLVFFLIVLTALSAGAKKLPPLEFVSGHELTLINKLMDTPRRYARVDTARYGGFTDYQRNTLVQQPAPISISKTRTTDGFMRATTLRARKMTRHSNWCQTWPRATKSVCCICL